MTLTERLDYFIRSIERVTFKHDEAQAESFERQWRETMLEASARIKAIDTPKSNNPLHDHFIKNHLEELHEQAHPDGCPYCEELEGDMRCRGCAEILATIDAIESLSTENSDISQRFDRQLQVTKDYVEINKSLTAEVQSAFAAARELVGPDGELEYKYNTFEEWKSRDSGRRDRFSQVCATCNKIYTACTCTMFCPPAADSSQEIDIPVTAWTDNNGDRADSKQCPYWHARDKNLSSYPYKEHWRDCNICQKRDPACVGKRIGDTADQSQATHDSDCALHNGPAYEPGPCDCSLSTADQGPKHHIACCFQVTGGLEPCDCPLSTDESGHKS